MKKYPATRTRMRRDALALKRHIDALCRALANNDIDWRIANIAQDCDRIANCIAADAREIQRVADERLDGRSLVEEAYAPHIVGGAA